MARAIPGATGYPHSRESRREGTVDPWNALSKSAGAVNGRAIPYTVRESRYSKQLTWACQVAGFSIQNFSHWAKDEELCSDDPSILGVVRTHAKELYSFDGEGAGVTFLSITTRPALRPEIHRQTGTFSFTQEHFLAWRGNTRWQYVTKSYPNN